MKNMNINRLVKMFNFYDDETTLMNTVRGNGLFLKRIDKPTYAMQVAAVKQNGCAIEYIENPSDEIKKIAVNQTGFAIEFIEDQTEALCRMAVKTTGAAIRVIKNPSDKVKLEAVKNDWMAVWGINNPSEKLCLIAVNGSYLALMNLKNPSEEVCLAAIKKSWLAIDCIKNPSEMLRIEAEKQKKIQQNNRKMEENNEPIGFADWAEWVGAHGSEHLKNIRREGFNGFDLINREYLSYLGKKYSLCPFDDEDEYITDCDSPDERIFEEYLKLKEEGHSVDIKTAEDKEGYACQVIEIMIDETPYYLR